MLSSQAFATLSEIDLQEHDKGSKINQANDILGNWWCIGAILGSCLLPTQLYIVQAYL